MTTAKDITPYVRQICDLEIEDISDSKLEQLVLIGWQDLVGRVAKREQLEEVENIDTYRKNTIDGSNATFYTKNSFQRYMCDFNGDMTLAAADVEVWDYNPNTQTRSQSTVTSFASDGTIVLTTAPSGGHKLFLNYCHTALPTYPMHSLMINALAHLTAALAYGKLEAQDYNRVGFRGLSVARMPQGYNNFYNKYQGFVTEILSYDGVVRRDDDRMKWGMEPMKTYLPPNRQ